MKMKKLLLAALTTLSVASAVTIVQTTHAESPSTQPSTPMQFTMKLLDGKDKNLADYQGKVVLIINTASHCGFTKQFTGLEELHQQYESKGLVVLGFPTDDFNQEEDTNEGIAAVCQQKYGVTFDMFSPIHVKGPDISPLYAYLLAPENNASTPFAVTWNFDKFLIAKDGTIIKHFKKDVAPDAAELRSAIDAELAK